MSPRPFTLRLATVGAAVARDLTHTRHTSVTIAAGIVLGAGVTWNIANVGALAGPLADAYGVSLAAVGLLTTALFVSHLAAQLPAGRLSDRLGARQVGLAAVALVAAGNAVPLLVDGYDAALAGRALMGLGTGAGFVAGLDLVRAGGGGALLQGAYGGSTMAGAGLAIMVVPGLEGSLGADTPYATALVLALACAPLLLLAERTPRLHEGERVGVLGDRQLLPLGLLQAANFGLSVIAGNWVVTLLERQGVERAVAGVAGGLILFAGILTRPLGGLVVARSPGRTRALVALSLVAVAAGALLLAARGPLVVATLGALVLGLAAGLPFAAIFRAAQALRPDAPAAAVGVVNGVGVLTILVGTPLAGLAFELPGEGAVAFAAIGALSLAALLPLARARL